MHACVHAGRLISILSAVIWERHMHEKVGLFSGNSQTLSQSRYPDAFSKWYMAWLGEQLMIPSLAWRKNFRYPLHARTCLRVCFLTSSCSQ